MKKTFVFAFAVLAAASQAIVSSIGFFPTPAIMQEGFDTTTVGTYNALPVFSVPAVMSRIGTGGQLVVRPYPGVNTIPNMCFGDGVNAQIKTGIPMRRFGGFFMSGINGVFSSTATFRFYDAANNPIGAATVALSPLFTWVGFSTIPKWKRVEILGSIPTLPGYVGMDSLRIRPN
jgi:hypothetical protein